MPKTQRFQCGFYGNLSIDAENPNVPGRAFHKIWVSHTLGRKRAEADRRNPGPLSTVNPFMRIDGETSPGFNRFRRPARPFGSYSFPPTCRWECVSITSAHTGGGNNTLSQRAARKIRGFSGPRSSSSSLKRREADFERPSMKRRRSGFQCLCSNTFQMLFCSLRIR